MSDRLTRRAVLVTGFASVAASPASARTGAWSPRASLPWAVQEVYGAPWRGKVVVAGGLAGRDRGIDILDRTGVYDPAADVWSEGPRLPAPTHHPVLATTGDRLYAFGGYRARNGGQWSAGTEVLAFDGAAWTEAGRMPAPQSETVALAHAGRVHLLGGRAPTGEANAGWRDQGDIADHRAFEPASGRWSVLHPLPAARNSAAGAVIDGQLYVVGGRTVAGGNTGRLDGYDPRADTWRTLRPMPQGAGGIAAAAVAGRLLVFGGEFFGASGGGVFRETWLYDPGRDLWTAAAPMRTPRHGLAGVAAGGAVLAIGGAVRASASGTSAVVEAWRP